MLSKHSPISRVLGVLALASLNLLSVAEAQPSGLGQGGSGNMMGGGWGMGWGMGGFGWLGVIVVCLVAVAFVVLMYRRQKV